MSITVSKLANMFHLNPEQMNVWLKKEGFQTGEPGNYEPTEKGAKYAHQKGADNGYGGYAFRGWNWVEWDEAIAEQLDGTPDKLDEIREVTKKERKERHDARYVNPVKNDKVEKEEIIDREEIGLIAAFLRALKKKQ